VVAERTSENMQVCLEKAPQARQYYSDAFPAYDTSYYGAPYELHTDKIETYSVETVNAAWSVAVAPMDLKKAHRCSNASMNDL
jgi:hypothetical protein